jgi:hypothetical protein
VWGRKRLLAVLRIRWYGLASGLSCATSATDAVAAHMWRRQPLRLPHAAHASRGAAVNNCTHQTTKSAVIVPVFGTLEKLMEVLLQLCEQRSNDIFQKTASAA